MESEVRALGELSDAEFGGDFPRRGSTDQDGIGAGANEFVRGGRKSRVIDEPPEQSVRVQEKAQKSLPGLEFVFGKRLEEFGAHGQFSLHATGLALAFLFAEWLKTNERLVAAGDDNLLAFAGLFNEAREMGFRVMNLDRGHIS